MWLRRWSFADCSRESVAADWVRIMKIPRFFALFAIMAVSLVRAQVAPAITAISDNQSGSEGAAVSLQVVVSGDLPLSYQWYKTGVAVAGATGSTYSIAKVALSDAGAYTVAVANAAGKVTSDAISLDVQAATAPVISYTPSQMVFFAGGQAEVEALVDSSASQPLTFVWKKDGKTVATTNKGDYVFPNAQVSDSGAYTVEVSNAGGLAISNPIALIILPPGKPSILTPPASTTIDAGASLALSAEVYSATDMTYQWYKDGVAIPGATMVNYGVNGATASNAGSYFLAATNSSGTVQSAAATVTVRPPVPPSGLVVQNSSLPLTVGGWLSLMPSLAAGTPPLTYQWRKDGVDIPGGTYSAFSKYNITAADAGVYTLVVSNAQGRVESNQSIVNVTVAMAPIIRSAPNSVALVTGNSIGLLVDADGIGALTYQWLKNGAAIPGATSYYFTPSTEAGFDLSGSYAVVVSDAAGSTTSSAATITMLPGTAPAITTQPSDATVPIGATLDLSLSYAGAPVPTIQWLKDGVAIPGASEPYYTVDSASAQDTGAYTATLTNPSGTITSRAAVVSVVTPALPEILSQPGNCSFLPGTINEVGVQLLQSQGATYQWYENGQAQVYGTRGVFDITQAGTYHVVVTNAGGSVTSDDFTVTFDPVATAPMIVGVSGSQRFNVGISATIDFTLASPSIVPDSVVWKKDGTVVSGTPGQYQQYCWLTLGNFTVSMVGSYVAEVTVAGKTYTSSAIKVDVVGKGAAPSVQILPGTITFVAGSSTFLAASTGGEQPVTLQWQRNGVDIIGATASDYMMSSVVAEDAGVYALVATNRIGTTKSAPVTVRVAAAPPPAAAAVPVITAQPASRTLFVNAGAEGLALRVLTSASDATFQWYKDGSPIAGATANQYYVQTITPVLAGKYRAVVSNSAGSVSSDEATITILTDTPGPVITTQPADVSAYAGGQVTLTAAATGNGALTYQWRKNGVAISGATATQLTLVNVQASDAGNYSVVVTDATGVASSRLAAVVVGHAAAPAFTTQPQSRVFAPGEVVTLSAAVSGYPQPTIQWYKQGVAIPGATDLTLTLGAISAALLGDYHAVATNDSGAATSATATVTAGPSPYAGAYFGTLSTTGGQWSLLVRTDGTGTLIAYLTNRQSAMHVDVVVAADGTFAAAGAEITGMATGGGPRALSVEAGPAAMATAGNFTLTGRINGGVLTGRLPEFNLTLSGLVDSAAGSGRYYQATALGSSSGLLYAIVAPSGEVLVVIISSSGIDGVISALNANGSLTSVTPGGDHIGLRVDAGGSSITGSVATGATNQTVNFAGLSDTVQAWKRLVNISSRANSGTGNNVAIGGFGVAGGGTKRLLLRAVGPTLNSQGIPVGEQMVDPTIEVHDALNGNAVIASADNWSDGTDATQLASLASQVGAATLSGGDNKSAAAILTVPAGVYTFIAAGKNQTTGIVLVEVYDADSADSAATLVNISTRAYCGAGDSVAIGGFGVSGNAPKKVLVRAVGPTLTTQGLTASEVLSDPTIEVHDALNGNAVIATNDNWTDNANTAQLAATGARVGATPLATADLTSSALLLTLPPGVYSFVVRGKGSASGIVLIEVYDVD